MIKMATTKTGFKQGNNQTIKSVISQNAPNRGQLKIFLSYAPGVGKTYAMIDEAKRRKLRGKDVVVGFIKSSNPKGLHEQLGDLEVVSPKRYNDFLDAQDEMDLAAILQRRPEYVLIDELEHTNGFGMPHQKRYEDVQDLLDAGIHVLTTLNIMHIESLKEVIRQLTGIVVKDTIPDTIVDKANEIIFVDLTVDALINRFNRGCIYNLCLVDNATKNLYKKENLLTLRELALRQIADEVDEDLQETLKITGLVDSWRSGERIMVCINYGQSSKRLIRTGASFAKKFRCEWIVVNVECTHFYEDIRTTEQKYALEKHFRLAELLGAEVVTLKGKSISGELIKFTKERGVTQILIGHSFRKRFEVLLRGSTIHKLLKKVKDVNFYIVSDDK